MAATGCTVMMLGRKANSMGTLRFNANPLFSISNGVLMVKASFQGPSMKDEGEAISKMIPQKQWKFLDSGETENDMVANPFSLGEVVKDDKRIFSHNFKIRSYDMGPNRTTTIETLMNLLQETALNHIKNLGLLNDGLGSTPEMSGRNLIWVLSRIHVVVDHYPSWDDDVQVDNWLTPSGNNGQRTEWIIRNCSTGQILTRATSMFVLMNKETRKLCKMTEGVRREMEPQYLDCPPIVDGDSIRLPKLDCSRMDQVQSGLMPRWSDLDANKHVNNVKYVGLMLESVPISFLDSHDLSTITLEYRRECGTKDVLQSLTSVRDETVDCSIDAVECDHLLRLESGPVVARSRTKWRPKLENN